MAKTRGGARKGAGRKKGGKNKSTLLRERAEAEYRSRVVALTDKLMDRQLQLAQGCSYLYRIDKDEKGKQKKPELVTDPEEIRSFLADEVSESSYYYITTEKPDLKSIQDMFDRTYGKAQSSVDLTSLGEKLDTNVTVSFVDGSDE